MATLADVSSGKGSVEDLALVQETYGEIMQKQTAVLTAWIQEQNILLDEVNKLKLIASTEVAEILDRYSEVMQRALESTAGLPVQMALAGPGQLDLDLALDYGKLQDELKAIRAELHRAMRKDMGIE